MTDEGVAQLEKFEQSTALIRTAYVGLFAEVGDVKQFIDRTADALNQRPLDKRMHLSG